MTRTVLNVLRALTGFESGRSCRRCSYSIPAADPFGISEGVCHPCREAAG